jgi:hypothetical protein
MRRPDSVKKAGPFRCASLANGHILISPAWSQYSTEWTLEEGGGPSFGGRMGLADDLERWLNGPYTEDEVEDGNKRIHRHDRELKKAEKAYLGNEKAT